MSDSDWSVRVSCHRLDVDEDGNEVGITVTVIEGKPQPTDVLQATLGAAAAVLAQRVVDQQLDGEGIVELLDEVWNVLADMIDSAVSLKTESH